MCAEGELEFGEPLYDTPFLWAARVGAELSSPKGRFEGKRSRSLFPTAGHGTRFGKVENGFPTIEPKINDGKQPNASWVKAVTRSVMVKDIGARRAGL